MRSLPRRLFSTAAPQPLRVRTFDAAQGGRRWTGAPTFGHPNSEIGASAATMRRRAAYAARNNAWVANGISAIVANAVGAGIKIMPAHSDPAVRADLAARFNAWTAEADADGVTDFYGLQALAVRAMAESGECFAQLVPGEDGLRVRLLDADMVPLDETRALGDGQRIIQGVELGAEGNRVAYHVRKERPDVVQSFGYELVRVPAEQMVHLFVPLSPGQVRGISWLAPVLLKLRDLDDYEDAQLVRQKIAAIFAGFVVAPGDGTEIFSGTPTDGQIDAFLEPGTLKVLPPGVDVKFGGPAAIGDGLEFAKTQLRAIAACLGVPSYLVDGNLSQANYSSLRAGLVEFASG
jgi:lambda family phage portal protein